MPSIITIDNHANILSSIGKTVDLHKRKKLDHSIQIFT